MTGELENLVKNAQRLVTSGYYSTPGPGAPSRKLSAALAAHPYFPVIAEVKLASPSLGRISPHRPERLLDDYQSAGAAALSVLTEPDRFGGSLDTLEVASRGPVPTLMKDIVVSEEQIDAAASRGASAVLLIQEVFLHLPRGRRDRLIDHAHARGLEALLEAGSEGALIEAASSGADLLGINQRDLGTFTVDRGKAAGLLPLLKGDARPAVVMSGIEDREAVLRAKRAGAAAVLVGGHLSSSPDPAEALRKLEVPR